MKIIIADTSPLYVQGVELVLGKTGITVDTIVVDSFRRLLMQSRQSRGLLWRWSIPGWPVWASLKR